MIFPKGGLMIPTIEGYFDESGDLDEPPHIFCVSGYYLTSEAAMEMDAAWREVLGRFEIPYFHMVDCAHGSGVFSAVAKPERVKVVKELIGIIKKYTIEGFSAICHGTIVDGHKKAPNAYALGVDMCMKAIESFMEMRRDYRTTAYFFESGHSHSGHAYNYVAAELKRLGATLTFGDKAGIPLLQAADLLAWQSAKYVKDRIGNKRPPRKDFESLMEHPHALVHVGIGPDKEEVGFEYFPLSRRSRYTSSFTVDYDGPIVFMREDGVGIPIVLVNSTAGWGPSQADDLVYVGFTQPAEKGQFALAFDRARLQEALGVIVDAAGANPLPGTRTVLFPNQIAVEDTPGGVLFTFGLASGAALSFAINSLDVIKDLEGLIEVLNGILAERKAGG